jgi:hypothetical protein
MAQAKNRLIVVPSLFMGALGAAGCSGSKLDISELICQWRIG